MQKAYVTTIAVNMFYIELLFQPAFSVVYNSTVDIVNVV